MKTTTPLGLVSLLVVVLLACPARGGASSLPATAGLPAVDQAIERLIADQQIAGAVTLVWRDGQLRRLAANGLSDRQTGTPMRTDALFWIASMTKPITAIAILRLQDDGRLHLDDPVTRYLPEYAALRLPSGLPASPTIRQLLTHTAGLGELSDGELSSQTELTDVARSISQTAPQFAPGSNWKYSQSGMNTAARIVEVVSGQRFDVYLKQTFFGPMGMSDTGYVPTDEQRARFAGMHNKNASDELQSVAWPERLPSRLPTGNGGLFSSTSDYWRFCRMLLDDGLFEGKRYLSAESARQMRTIQTGDFETGLGYAWAVGCNVVRTPKGHTLALEAGAFGHAGGFGTLAWIEPKSRSIYLLMVQRTKFDNSETQRLRGDFQSAVSAGLRQQSLH